MLILEQLEKNNVINQTSKRTLKQFLTTTPRGEFYKDEKRKQAYNNPRSSSSENQLTKKQWTKLRWIFQI